jgi:predicted transposase/invertase (TIGR01784 family)
MKNLKAISFSSGLENATGEIPEKLTNDVVLHSITQNNNEVLRGLTAALLMVPVSSVTNVVLLNPIDYRNYTDKEIILDIKAQIDGRKIMNIELQMLLSTDSTWWINRSLLYLCRTYDNLEGGADYTKIRPSMQVSIVCKDLFSDVEPEFYAQYYLENVRNRHVYTRDFSLRVLYLNHIDLATKEDKENELDYWAQAFLAKTWDELKSLAEKAEVFREVAESMYTVNADVSQRSIAEAHRKYVETYTTLKNCLERAEKRADDAEAEVKRLREELAQLKAEKRDL